MDLSFLKRWQFWLAITVPLFVILGITLVLTGWSRFPTAFPSALVAWGTLMLAVATYILVRSNIEREKRDRKDSLLNEIRDCVFEIQTTSLEPLTTENVLTREHNIALKYGTGLTRLEYFRDAIIQILDNRILHKIACEVANNLVAVMVIAKAKNNNTEITEKSFEGFIGYKNIKTRILSEYEENKDTVALWHSYVQELSHSETVLLAEINNIKKGLL